MRGPGGPRSGVMSLCHHRRRDLTRQRLAPGRAYRGSRAEEEAIDEAFADHPAGLLSQIGQFLSSVHDRCI